MAKLKETFLFLWWSQSMVPIWWTGNCHRHILAHRHSLPSLKFNLKNVTKNKLHLASFVVSFVSFHIFQFFNNFFSISFAYFACLSFLFVSHRSLWLDTRKNGHKCCWFSYSLNFFLSSQNCDDGFVAIFVVKLESGLCVSERVYLCRNIEQQNRCN